MSDVGKVPAGNMQELTDSPLACILVALGFAGMTTWGIYAMFSPALPILAACSDTLAVACLFVSKLAEIVLLATMLARPSWVIGAVGGMAVPLAFSLFLPAFAIALMFWVVGAEPPAVALVASWALVGIGDALLSFAWAVLLSKMPTRWSSLAIAGGGAAATPLFLLISDARDPVVGLVGMMLVALASCAVSTYMIKKGGREPLEETKDYDTGPALEVREAALVAVNSIAYGFLVIMLCLFGTAAVIVAALAGLAASFLAIVWAMQRVEKRWETSTVQHMTVPVIVAALLLVPQLDQVGQMLCGAVATATFAYASLMKWTEMAVAGYEFQLHPVKRTASERLMQWAGFIVGGALAFAAFHGEPVSQQALYLIVCAIAVALVAAFALLGATASPTSSLASLADSGEEALTIEPPKNAAPFRDRCAALIEQYGLTEREGEVFVLLAKGRNTEYIQKKLFISGNTAKTHILHIYRKMGISSQQSLIDQVDKRNEHLE